MCGCDNHKDLIEVGCDDCLEEKEFRFNTDTFLDQDTVNKVLGWCTTHPKYCEYDPDYPEE